MRDLHKATRLLGSLDSATGRQQMAAQHRSGLGGVTETKSRGKTCNQMTKNYRNSRGKSYKFM